MEELRHHKENYFPPKKHYVKADSVYLAIPPQNYQAGFN